MECSESIAQKTDSFSLIDILVIHTCMQGER